MAKNTIIRCKKCGQYLCEESGQYSCLGCGNEFLTRDGILILEDDAGVDLRISPELFNVHKLLNEYKYYDTKIASDVDRRAHLHTVRFSQYHAELVAPYISDSIIVDMGCGQLPYINSFPDTGISAYYGFDLSEESLTIARVNYRGNFPLMLVKHGVSGVPVADNAVDIVISSEVLEHLDDPAAYLKEIYRICKKGAYLSLSTPCASVYFIPYSILSVVRHPGTIVPWFKKINCDRYWPCVIDMHPALRPKALKSWIEKAGFRLIRHQTRLWPFETPIRLSWRFFSALEKIGVKSSGRVFGRYLDLTNQVLNLELPGIKWCGTRQFVLCQKI